MNPEEADRNELSDALAELDEPGPLLAPVPDPPESAAPPLELEWTEAENPLLQPRPLSRPISASTPVGGVVTVPETGGPTNRGRWLLVSLACLVVAAVLAFVAIRMTSADPADEEDAAPPAETTEAPAEPFEPTQLTPDVANLLTIIGLTPEQLKTVDSQPLSDAAEGDSLPGQPRVEQAGAVAINLDPPAMERLFGGSGEAPCGTLNDIHGAPFNAACAATVSEPTSGQYLVVWADTGQSYLDPASADASLRASVDVNSDGGVDVPANIVSQGSGAVEVTDGATGLGTRVLILGTAVAVMIPIEQGTLPQWAFATAATTGQMSDIIDWQRWIVDAGATRQEMPPVFGSDVLP
jgi:hypothetical protein